MIETEAWGFESENLFLNSVAVFETDKTPRESLTICNEIEALLGRRRNPNATTYENRPIDIDILFYENEIIDEIDLKIPHPLIPQRDFVLIPLKELMPNFIHPALNKKVKEL
jgi:2-amino-4-hydroxy-6-hydroxymethyldihydropteridine diphosphokinase